MDSMDDEDITAVMEMKKEYHAMLGNRSSRRPGLSFEKDRSSYNSSSNPVTMQQLLAKEQKEKEKQLELIDMKGQLSRLRNELTSQQSRYKQANIQHEKQMANIKLEQKTDSETLQTWKKQMDLLLAKEDTTREQLKDVRSELNKSTSSYEQKIRDLQKEKRHLEMNLQELQQDSYQKQQELRNNLMRKESELNICQVDMKGITEQLQQTRRRCNNLSNQLAEAEDDRMTAVKSEQRVKELEQQLSAYEGERTITRTMKDQIDRLSSLEAENRKLKNDNAYFKSTQENVFLIREESESLKKKLERAETRCVEFVNLEMENKTMKEQLSKWETMKDGSSEKKLSAEEMRRRMIDLQASNTSLLERQGLLQSSLHTAEEKLRISQQQLEVSQVKLSGLDRQVTDNEQLIVRLKRKLLLVSKERDSVKSILGSYEREQKVDAASQQKKLIQQLRETVQGSQKHISSLETELEQKSQELAQSIASSKLLENRLTHSKSRPTYSSEADSKVIVQLREQVASMEQKLEELLTEKEDLQLSLDRAHMQGVYEPEKTKVLSFTLNPFALARKRRREEIETIIEENKRLKTRIEVIEENKGELEDITQHVDQKLHDSGGDSAQIKEFQEKITSAELKNKRLMEVFKKKSTELREAVYRLLGYMLQLPTENQYKLRSVYADSPDDTLLFQQGEDGNLQLLETPYSAQLTEQIDMYLTQSNSIPAFLCGLNMELFSRQTVSM